MRGLRTRLPRAERRRWLAADRQGGAPAPDAFARDARLRALGTAWRSGALSFLRAYALVPVVPVVPVVLAAPRHAGQWIERAQRRSCLRLEEEVSAALVAAELDPEGFAASGGLPEARNPARVLAPGPSAEDRDRQTGAQPTGAAETSRLMINGPRDAMRLLRAVLCTVRRRLELGLRAGRPPLVVWHSVR